MFWNKLKCASRTFWKGLLFTNKILKNFFILFFDEMRRRISIKPSRFRKKRTTKKLVLQYLLEVTVSIYWRINVYVMIFLEWSSGAERRTIDSDESSFHDDFHKERRDGLCSFGVCQKGQSARCRTPRDQDLRDDAF